MKFRCSDYARISSHFEVSHYKFSRREIRDSRSNIDIENLVNVHLVFTSRQRVSVSRSMYSLSVKLSHSSKRVLKEVRTQILSVSFNDFLVRFYESTPIPCRFFNEGEESDRLDIIFQ